MFLKEISTFLIQGGWKIILNVGTQINTKKNDFAKFTMQFSKQKNVTHVKCLFFSS